MNKGKETQNPDMHKGAVEGGKPGDRNQVSEEVNMEPRSDRKEMVQSGTDFPERDPRGEHSGQHKSGEPVKDEQNPEGVTQNQDPGHRQKRNQGEEEDDPLAA